MEITSITALYLEFSPYRFLDDINFMVLSSLKHYQQSPHEAKLDVFINYPSTYNFLHTSKVRHYTNGLLFKSL